MVWDAESLELLRLCRNRAYHKVNTKKRQHLPASLSAFMAREWMSMRPNDKFSAKYILSVYNEHFDQGSQDKTPKKKVVKRKRSPPAAGEPEQEPQPVSVVKSENDHSDKQWSEEMLETLIACGERATKDPSQEDDFATKLQKEWLLVYPQSTLSTRNLKSRLTVYQKTRSDAPPAAKRKKVEVLEVPRTPSKRGRKPKGKFPALETSTVPVDDVSDEFVPETDHDALPVTGDQACPKHWMHMYPNDQSNACLLTEKLLQIRESLKPSYPDCDLYSVKKPKGE